MGARQDHRDAAVGRRRIADAAASPRRWPPGPTSSRGRARTTGARVPAVAGLLRRDGRRASRRVARRRYARRTATRDVRRGGVGGGRRGTAAAPRGAARRREPDVMGRLPPRPSLDRRQ